MSESGHVPISATNLLVKVGDIIPSPENNRLYKPVDQTDPEILALAQSIREHGVRDPLVVTQDYYIISGHRRYVAARLAGFLEVPCRIEPINRDDPRFMTLLREHNRQREKTFDEKVREEIVSANPEEAYRVLIEHRRKRAAVVVDAIEIRGMKTRAAITENKGPFLRAILQVIEQRRKFWPLSDRQVHYALLNNPPLIHAKKKKSIYRNDIASYKSLTDLLTRARLAGDIPWAAIADVTRPVDTWSLHPTTTPFIRTQIDDFLKGYYRNLLQSQPNHIEILGEKLTVQSIISPVAMEFCITLTIGRGYSSITPRYDMAQRFRRSGKSKFILLILSDLDPDGDEIAHSYARSLRDDFGIANLEPVKVCLTGEQVKRMNIPPQLKAKTTSSNYKKFFEKHGDDAYELEAIEPLALQQILRDAIDNVLDIDAFNQEVEQEKKDAAKLDVMRRKMAAGMEDITTE